MVVKYYDKLVRDNIPDIIIESNKTCIIEQVNDYKIIPYLYKKLLEEVNEFLSDESTSELVDILEVVFTIAEKHGVSSFDLLKEMFSKREEKGTFNKNYILKEVKED